MFPAGRNMNPLAPTVAKYNVCRFCVGMKSESHTTDVATPILLLAVSFEKRKPYVCTLRLFFFLGAGIIGRIRHTICCAGDQPSTGGGGLQQALLPCCCAAGSRACERFKGLRKTQGSSSSSSSSSSWKRNSQEEKEAASQSKRQRRTPPPSLLKSMHYVRT